MSEEHLAAYRKRLLVLRNLLVGRGFHDALCALEFGSRHTVEMRKDGATPGFDHQVSIALHVMTLPDLMHPEETVATVMTHDLCEDYGISPQEIRSIFRNALLADRVATATDRLSKVWRGEKRDEAALFEAMSEDPIASIVKPCDRINNQNGMVGVFSEGKMLRYMDETESMILPMVKRAKRRFPHQTMAYENLAWTLRSQIGLVRGLMAGKGSD